MLAPDISFDTGLPRAAEVPGIADRYRYWQGRSGERYLFTRVEPVRLREFTSAVVVLLRKPTARQPGGDLLWSGEIDMHGDLKGARLKASSFKVADAYVHLLAETASQRSHVLKDLFEGRQ